MKRAVQFIFFLSIGLLLESASAAFDPFQAKDPYLTLGIERSATREEARTRYRALLKRYHPDRAGRYGLDPAAATAVTQNLNAAFAWLKKNHVPKPAPSAPPAAARPRTEDLGAPEPEKPEFRPTNVFVAELRAVRAAREFRRELSALVDDAGEGFRSAADNKVFQDAVVRFIEEDFIRSQARVKSAAVEPFLNLIADERRALALRLELLRRPADYGSLTEGAIEAARVLHGLGEDFPRLLDAVAEGDAFLSGGRREERALREMLSSLAREAHDKGNRDARHLLRALSGARSCGKFF